MNQGKFDMVKQMIKININTLGISELKWVGMGEFNSNNHMSTTVSKNPLEEMEQSSKGNKRVQNVVLECNLKNDRMISVCFQGKPFNTTITQVYVPTIHTEEAEVDQFYEDLEYFLELRPNMCVSVCVCVYIYIYIYIYIYMYVYMYIFIFGD